MFANLAKAIRSEIIETQSFSSFGVIRSLKTEKDLQDDIDDAILVDPIESKAYLQNGKNYLEVCRQDQDLKPFISKAVALRKESYRKSIENLDDWERA